MSWLSHLGIWCMDSLTPQQLFRPFRMPSHTSNAHVSSCDRTYFHYIHPTAMQRTTSNAGWTFLRSSRSSEVLVYWLLQRYPQRVAAPGTHAILHRDEACQASSGTDHQRWMITSSWLSAYVMNVAPFFMGMMVFSSISLVTTSPVVFTPIKNEWRQAVANPAQSTGNRCGARLRSCRCFRRRALQNNGHCQDHIDNTTPFQRGTDDDANHCRIVLLRVRWHRWPPQTLWCCIRENVRECEGWKRRLSNGQPTWHGLHSAASSDTLAFVNTSVMSFKPTLSDPLPQSKSAHAVTTSMFHNAWFRDRYRLAHRITLLNTIHKTWGRILRMDDYSALIQSVWHIHIWQKASGQMTEAPREPNQILGSLGTGHSKQNSPHIDAERATLEKSNEECCQEPQTLRSTFWWHQLELAKSQQTTLPPHHQKPPNLVHDCRATCFSRRGDCHNCLVSDTVKRSTKPQLHALQAWSWWHPWGSCSLGSVRR